MQKQIYSVNPPVVVLAVGVTCGLMAVMVVVFTTEVIVRLLIPEPFTHKEKHKGSIQYSNLL